MKAFVVVLSLGLAACQTMTQSSSTEIPAAAQSAFANAVAAQRAGDLSEAERQFQQLEAQYPQLSGPPLNLALLYAQTNRPEQADAHFKRALQCNPNNLVIYEQYGIWLRKQARFQEAEAMYQQALARDANRAEAHLDLAILYDLYMGKLPQALEHYQRYLALTGDEKSPVHGWVAELQRRMKAG